MGKVGGSPSQESRVKRPQIIHFKAKKLGGSLRSAQTLAEIMRKLRRLKPKKGLVLSSNEMPTIVDDNNPRFQFQAYLWSKQARATPTISLSIGVICR